MIVKLSPIDKFVYSPGQEKNRIDYINVYRAPYSSDLIAYFVRTRAGTSLMINNTLTFEEQARAINLVERNIKKCGIANMGLIRGDWQYICGGPCCEKKKRKIKGIERSD